MSLVWISLYVGLKLRVIWVVALVCSSLISDSYFEITKSHLDWDSIEMLWNARSMAGSAIAHYGPQIKLPILRAVGLLAVLLIPARFKDVKVAHFLVPFVPLSMALVIFYETSGLGIEGLPSVYETLGLSFGFTTNRSGPKEKPLLNGVTPQKSVIRNILLVVDESVRGDYIDLNEIHGATPYLASQESKIANFGAAVSATNCSHTSNAILRLGANPSLLGTKKGDPRYNPSLWQYASKAGFFTVYIDSQSPEGVLTNYMDAAELRWINDKKNISGNAEYRDLSATGLVSQILNSKGRHFIYWNKNGAHFPYSLSYPKSSEIFSPGLLAGEPLTDRNKMINSYKNAIYWSVDLVFKTLLAQIDLGDTIIIYTSDHGQNLMDDGTSVTHCRARYTSPYEGLVPMLVLTGQADLRSQFINAARRNCNATSHFQIFPTLLHLMGYDSKALRGDYYLTLLDGVADPLGFASGSIFGYFGRKPQWNTISDIIRNQSAHCYH